MGKKDTIIEAIYQNTGLVVKEEQLFKLTTEPICHGNQIFHTYAAQCGEFGVHVYEYATGTIRVFII